MTIRITLGMLFALALLSGPLATEAEARYQPPTTSTSKKAAANKKPAPKKVRFRISKVNAQKKAELKEQRKNFRPTASHKAKRRKDAKEAASQASSSNGQRDTRRDARNFNDPATRRYGRRDLPAISTGDARRSSMSRRSLESSVSSVLTRQPMQD